MTEERVTYVMERAGRGLDRRERFGELGEMRARVREMRGERALFSVDQRDLLRLIEDLIGCLVEYP